MGILPRILLHLFLTWLLLAAACLGFVLQSDATADMKHTLLTGRSSFQNMESLQSRFESLNTAWKANEILKEAGKVKNATASSEVVEPDKDDKNFQNQMTGDVAEAQSLFARLVSDLDVDLHAPRDGSPPLALPLLGALFAESDPSSTARSLVALDPIGEVGSATDLAPGGESKPDAIDRPRRAGMSPWSEDWAVKVRAEMNEASRRLDASYERARESAFRKARRAMVLGFASLLITAPLTLFSSITLIRALRKPLQRLMKATEAVAAGRFDIALPASGRNEISRLAGAFNRMSAELARAKKREADFLSVAGHELKTPLTLIRVFAGRVRSLLKPGAEAQMEASTHLDRIESEVDQLSRKVLDLLDLGVIEAGQLTLERNDLPARGFLTMAAGAFKPVAAEKGIQYEISIDSSVPTLSFDPDRMNQVLRNLLDNAFKFNVPGGRVTFGAKTIGEWVQIEVSDTGIGIPAGQLEEIFEKYARARGRPGKRQTSGTGLGLAVARGIVIAHGGTIEARSAQGSGSSFIVRLPIRAAHIGEEVA